MTELLIVLLAVMLTIFGVPIPWVIVIGIAVALITLPGR